MNTPPPNAPDPLAVALAKLDPAPHGFDWNALMFAAGRASKGRALTFWRVVAGGCALAACGFAAALFARPVVERDRVVYVERPAPAAPPAPKLEPPAPAPAPPTAPSWNFDPPPEPGAAVRWLTLRNEVLTGGLGTLPDPK